MQPNTDFRAESIPGDAPLGGIPLLIAHSQAAFRRDLPELLRDRKLFRRWVAYHGDERVGIARSEDELYVACERRGLRRGEFVVRCIMPEIPTGYGRHASPGGLTPCRRRGPHVPLIVRKLPFEVERRTEVPVPGGAVTVLPLQLVLSVSITPKHVPLDLRAPRFPAVLDTGFSQSFLLQEQQRNRWAGLRREDLEYVDVMHPYGRVVPVFAANVWIHPNMGPVLLVYSLYFVGSWFGDWL